MIMNRLGRSLALLAICLSLTAGWRPAVADTGDEIRQAEQGRARDSRRLERAKEERRETVSKEKGVLAALDKLDRQMEKTRAEIGKTQRRIDAVQRNIAALESDIARLVDRQKARKGLVGQRIRANYEMNYLSKSGLFALAFKTNSVADALVRLQYISKIREKDDAVIQAFFEAQETLEARKDDLETRKSELHRQQSAMTRQREALEKDRLSRRATLAALRDNRELQERTIRELSDQIQRYNDLIRRLTRVRASSAQANRTRPTVRLGDTRQLDLRGGDQSVSWPVEGVVVGNASDQLEGITVRAAEGTPVKAALDGSVEYARWFEGLGFGKLVVLNHGAGLRTFYAHLLDIEVEEGARVQQGATIGTVGSTGSMIGPVLYFEMRRQFDVINSTRARR